MPGPALDLPSRSDSFVTAMTARLGGPLGRRAERGLSWWNPARAAIAVGVLVYLLGAVAHLSCRMTRVGQSIDQYKNLCYSDIPLLYPGRGLMQGNTPYLDSGDYPVLEYPVLTGWFLELERRITAALGGLQGLNLTDQQQVDSTLVFVDVNLVLLGLFFLVTVWAQVATVRTRPWDAMMVAGAPVVAAAAEINWDLLAVALTALAMLAWSRRRPALTGVLLGLGMAAKLYPALLLGPLLILCLRARRGREFGATLAGFVISWGLVNLPALVLAPDAWLDFWRFNSERSGDFGSIWYVFSLAGHPVPNLNAVSAGLFAIGCVLIALLIVLAPRRPRFGSVAFLVLVAFLMTNKVYSPQYVLWLLPFVVLARPRWRDWIIFTAGELCYFVAIWWHLGGLLAPGNSAPDKIYWFAVVVRLAAEAWVAAMVVRDLLVPRHDPVRHGGADDPGGGVLDGAVDARWLRHLRVGTASEPVAVAPRRAAPPAENRP